MQARLKIKNLLVDLKLSPDRTKVPVPKWLFKIAEIPKTKEMIAFLVLNNPHTDTVDADIISHPCNGLFQSTNDVIRTATKKWKPQLSQMNS